MGVRLSFDDPMQTQTAKVVGHASRRDRLARQGAHPFAQLGMSEPLGLQNETDGGRQKFLRSRFAVSQGAGALTLAHNGAVDLLKRGFAQMAVVTDTLERPAERRLA